MATHSRILAFRFPRADYGIAKCQTQLSASHTHTHTHTHTQSLYVLDYHHYQIHLSPHKTDRDNLYQVLVIVFILCGKRRDLHFAFLYFSKLTLHTHNIFVVI